MRRTACGPNRVFAVGRLHECVDAREGGLMAAAEQRDVAIDDRVCGIEPKFQRAPDFLVLFLLRDARQRLDRFGAMGCAPLHAMPMSPTMRLTATSALFASCHAKLLNTVHLTLSLGAIPPN
jgi:hypothetical protein